MSLTERVQLVEALYSKLELEITAFQEQTKLGCVSGCGKCCNNPDIDASPLEFLPWAYHLYLKGKAEAILDQLNATTELTKCYIYHPFSEFEGDKGSCSDYKHRGLICRLFGFGATKDKYGKLRLATCKIIKEGQKVNFDQSTILINEGLPVPIFTDYYMNLSQIDFQLGNVVVPINKALKLALEEVLQYYAYRPFPEGHIDSE
jgi:Fe-S-cluster containining protein